MTEVIKDKIMKFLQREDYKPLKLSKLAGALDIKAEDYSRFKSAFEQLHQAGRVILAERNLVSLPAMSGRVIGTFRANPKGFGFVTPLEPTSHGALFIPPGQTIEAMTGDIVVAKVQSSGKRAGQTRYTGKIVEILERAKNRFVGTLIKQPQGWAVQPDGSAFTDPISVDDVTAKNAKPKDKVVVEIISYPTAEYFARGVIIDVLGKAGRYDTEVNSIIHQFHLPRDFNNDCLEQARLAAESFKPEEADDREDITDKVIITIDPPDAKDFDDAISLEKDSDGNSVLGVHIADVSSFIGFGTKLDEEAKNRGNSVYLPLKTIPMLPEVLSNGICSLQPGQKRFVKSAYITYDKDGNIISRRFANSIISSFERLTYQQADKILKAHTGKARPDVVRLLKDMESLSRLIEKRKRKAGMLHLDLPETELEFDKAGLVVDAHPADNSYPHTIIEMFMVEANEAVAGLLDKLNVPFMRRIHPEPDSLAMKNLSQLVKSMGLSLPRRPDREAIQNLLDYVKDKDCSLAVNMAVLRSFEKAIYSPLNVGHYALASTHYCHFTSPIRRYADLLVHRALQCYLQGCLDAPAEGEVLHRQDLKEIGEHITFAEQRADDAEMELKTVLILQMLSKHVGSELDCVVTGLAKYGVFVQSRKYGVEGLIQLEDLGPDRWKHDAKTQRIAGLNSGYTFYLGLPIKVRIVSVNVPARHLNVAPAQPLFKVAKKRKNAGEKPSKKERVKRRSHYRR